MAKKRNRLSDRLRALVTLVLLNGLFTPEICAADPNSGNQSPNELVYDATPLTGTELYPEVTLNGNTVGPVRLGYADGKFYASAGTLRQLGLRLHEKNAGQVCLSDIPQLQTDYDARQQTLKLTVPLRLLDTATTRLNLADAATPAASTSRGMLLNYDLYAARERSLSVSSFTELRAFQPSGVFSSTQLTRNSAQKYSGDHDNRFSRLDTRWQSSFPDRLLTVTAGDTLTSSLPWSRPTRIAGIQLGTDFSLKPYQPTTPLPSFLGSATLPSDVELYINGVKHYNGSVPAGNFEISSLPNISGAGNAQVMVTDALGRTTVQNFSFYNDLLLLRQGLTEWSAELGVVRRNYGYSSFDYDNVPVFSGTWRRGGSNSLTVGSHAEATNSLANAGVSTDWVPSGRSGTLSATLAISADSGQGGSLYGAGYRWSGYNFTFSTMTTLTTGRYHDAATRYGPSPPALSSNSVVGYGTESLGNFSLSYLHFRYPQESSIRYAGANWFKSVTKDIYLNAGVSQNVDNSRDSSVWLMMTFAFSGGMSAGSMLQRTNNQTGYMINASQMHPPEGGWGWGWSLAASRQSSRQGAQGEVGYQGRHGNVYTGVNQMSGTHYDYAGARGSLVSMAGGLFAAREISSGFAVVSTDGIAGVPVKLENNLTGTSDDQGLLLVTPLNSYQNNLLSIDPMDLPASMRINRISADATPADRSGVLVKFDITPVRAALVTLVDTHGHAVAQGSIATLDSGQNAVVGFDGMAYFDVLGLYNRLRVTTPTGVCTVQFRYPAEEKGIPQTGPLTCR